MLKLDPTRGIIGGSKRRGPVYKEKITQGVKHPVIVSKEERLPSTADNQPVIIKEERIIIKEREEDTAKLLAEALQSFKGEIDGLIHSAIKNLPKEIQSMLQSLKGIALPQSAVPDEDAIQIDESVADVGIGVQPKLEKGKGVSQISKEETKSDTKLSSAKSKLQRLKKKAPSKKKAKKKSS